MLMLEPTEQGACFVIRVPLAAQDDVIDAAAPELEPALESRAAGGGGARRTGRCWCWPGAGSGKTRVLTTRIAA